MSALEATPAIDGVRLLSHRPSVLDKVEHLASEEEAALVSAVPAPRFGEEGLALTGPGWEDRLKALLAGLSLPERACLLAVRLDDHQALPLPAEVLLERARTDWFPEFLSHGLMRPHFQPIVALTDGRAYGREALMRGTLGATEVRGGELMAAAEAHDALYSFDARARTAALEIGLPLLPEGELLFVNLDPRPVLDVEGSLRSTWTVAARLGADPRRICLELTRPERCPDRELLRELAEGHRARGARIALDDLSGGADSVAILEALRPDVAKVDHALTRGIERSSGRRRIVAALVAYAHELGCLVVGEGIERVDEFQVMRELGVDFGQGFYFGQPTARPMAVDTRVVRRTL